MTHPTPTSRLLLALAVLGLSAACAGAGPQQTVARYGDALRDDDPAAAWEHLTPDVRAQLTFEEFKARWDDIRKTTLPAIDGVADPEHTDAHIAAELHYNDYDHVSLRLDDDGWKITGGVLNVYAQKTAREALTSFVRAMDHRRYDILMRFIPSDYAQHMTTEDLKKDFERRSAEIDELVAALKTALANPIRERGPRAWMKYGQRELVMVREGDAWKVEDPD